MPVPHEMELLPGASGRPLVHSIILQPVGDGPSHQDAGPLVVPNAVLPDVQQSDPDTAGHTLVF